MPPVRVLVAFLLFARSPCPAPHAREARRLGRLLESIGGSSARRGPEPTPGCSGDAAPGLCRDGTRSRAARDASCRFSTFVPRVRCGVSYGFSSASPFSVGFFHAASRLERGAAGTATSARLWSNGWTAGRLRPSSSATPTGDLRLPPDPLRVARPSCPWLADRWCERSEESTGGPIKTWRAFARVSVRQRPRSGRSSVRSTARTGRFAHRPRREVFRVSRFGRAGSCRSRRRLTAG